MLEERMLSRKQWLGIKAIPQNVENFIFGVYPKTLEWKKIIMVEVKDNSLSYC